MIFGPLPTLIVNLNFVGLTRGLAEVRLVEYSLTWSDSRKGPLMDLAPTAGETPGPSGTQHLCLARTIRVRTGAIPISHLKVLMPIYQPAQWMNTLPDTAERTEKVALSLGYKLLLVTYMWNIYVK